MKIQLSLDEGGFCAVFKDPRNPNIKHAETLLPFYEINKLKRGNANVRPPEEKKRPYVAMLHSVERTPNEFHVKNRGITYICTDLSYDADSKMLTITLPDSSELKGKKGEPLRCGIADGGHTFDVITKTVANEKDYDALKEQAGWQIPYSRVHFISTKDLSNIEPIVEALNTSTQVKEISLHEYQNRFAGLKRALDNVEFPLELVAFTENEGKEWDVNEVIQRMSTFLPERWLNHQPIQAYKSKNKSLKLFLDPQTQGEFEEIYPVIRDVITMPEFIESEFSNHFLGKLEDVNGVRKLKKPRNRPGTPYTTEHKLNLAITLPLGAAFRTLLNKNSDDDTYDWVTDYKSIFRDCSEELFNLFLKKSSKVGQISHLASDPDYWGGAMRIVNKAKEAALSHGPITRKRASKQMDIDDTEKDKEAVNEE